MNKNYGQTDQRPKYESWNSEIIKENIDSALADIGVEKGFLKCTPFAREVRPTTAKWDLIKQKAPAELKKKSPG